MNKYLKWFLITTFSLVSVDYLGELYYSNKFKNFKDYDTICNVYIANPEYTIKKMNIELTSGGRESNTSWFKTRMIKNGVKSAIEDCGE